MTPAPAPVPSSSTVRRGCGDAGPAVRQHWGTPVGFAAIDPVGLVSPSAAGIGAEGPALQHVPAAEILTDPEAVAARFRASFDALAAAHDPDLTPAVDAVAVEVQIWRHGYQRPATGHPSDLVAWWVLDATPTHTDAGAVAFADPRTGSPLTPVPGRPWGRHLVIRPTPGAHVAVPGWLTSSVMPVERGQYVLVAIASTVR